MSTLNLSIQGMHCGGCVGHVTQRLRELPAVEPTQVNVGSAQVTYDPAKASPADIVAAIDRLGFKAAPRAGEQP